MKTSVDVNPNWHRQEEEGGKRSNGKRIRYAVSAIVRCTGTPNRTTYSTRIHISLPVSYRVNQTMFCMQIDCCARARAGDEEMKGRAPARASHTQFNEPFCNSNNNRHKIPIRICASPSHSLPHWRRRRRSTMAPACACVYM